MTESPPEFNDKATRPRAEAPLESWKEIAAYLQRDVKTAHRWEKRESLPVYRHQHLSRSSVYAYPSELDAWRANRKPVAESTRSAWWRPVPAFASTIALVLALMMAGSGPRVGALVQAADSSQMTIRRVWAGPDAITEGGRPSPDGRYLSYTDWETADLAIHDLATGANRRVTKKKPGDPYAFPEGSMFSPDGSQIAYRWWIQSKDCELRTIALDGSEARVLYRAMDGAPCPYPMDWSQDGKHILTKLGARPVLIAVADRSNQDLAIENPGRMGFSPDGSYIAYDAPPAKNARQSDVYVYERATQRSLPLVQHPAAESLLGWSPDGRHVLFTSDRRGTRDAWLIAVSGGQPRGEPMLVRSDMGGFGGMGFTRAGAYFFSGSAGGGRDVFSTRLDIQTGKLLSPPVEVAGSYLGSNWGPDFSRDGKFLAYVSGQGGVIIQSLETSEKKLINPGIEIRRAGPMSPLRWAPDGRSFVVTGVDGQGRQGMFRIDSLTGEATFLFDPAARPVLTTFDLSSDGKKVFYLSSLQSLYVWDSESGLERQLGDAVVWSWAVSPDGGQLAFFGSGGQAEPTGLYVMPSAGGSPRLLVRAADRRGAVAWSPDGRQLVYATPFDSSGAGTATTVRAEFWRVPSQGGEPQPLGLTVDGMMAALRVHPDGQRIVYQTRRSSPEIWVMENFLPEQKASR